MVQGGLSDAFGPGISVVLQALLRRTTPEPEDEGVHSLLVTSLRLDGCFGCPAELAVLAPDGDTAWNDSRRNSAGQRVLSVSPLHGQPVGRAHRFSALFLLPHRHSPGGDQRQLRIRTLGFNKATILTRPPRLHRSVWAQGDRTAFIRSGYRDKCHRLGGLTRTFVYCLTVWRLDAQGQDITGLLPSEASVLGL